jgi:hypothetical protein
MLDLFTNLGIVAGTILALGAILKPLYMMVRRVEQVHTKVMVDLPAWQANVDKGLKELYPNSGSSIHDKVTNTNKGINSANREIANVKRMLQDHLADTGSHNVRQIRASFQLDTNPTSDPDNS